MLGQMHWVSRGLYWKIMKYNMKNKVWKYESYKSNVMKQKLLSLILNQVTF